MKILELRIKNYKGFEEFIFRANDFGTLKFDAPNISFYIGENGSGKTTFLEAIVMIFTNIMLDQETGFSFCLVYEIVSDSDKTIIVKATNEGDGEIVLSTYSLKDNESYKNVIRDSFVATEQNISDLAWLHPGKILTIGSGPKNKFEELIVDTPIKYLQEKIWSGSEENSDEYKNSFENLLFNPQVINFENSSLIYPLVSLLFFYPEQMEENDYLNNESPYLSKIKTLKTEIRTFNEKGFSLRIDSLKLEELRTMVSNDVYQTDAPSLFLEILEKILFDLDAEIINGDECTTHYFEKDRIFTKVFKSIKIDEDNRGENEIQRDESIAEEFTPMDVLTTLMIAHRIGLITDSSIYLHDGEKDALLTEDIFSDGEWYWLCKMGLIIVSQTAPIENMLLLFDEPDAFLNEGWIEDFINNIDIFSSTVTKEKTSQEIRKKTSEFLIVTHSVLMLTDALKEQVYYFEKDNEDKKITCQSINFNTFGADRGYISSNLFLNDRRTGKFVERKINDAVTGDELKGIIEQLGQGYDRFVVQELYLRNRKKSDGRS